MVPKRFGRYSRLSWTRRSRLANRVSSVRVLLRLMSLRLKKETMHPSLERKWLMYFAVGELQRMSYKKQGFDLEHDLRKLAKPNNWWTDPSSSPRVALDAAFSTASKVLIQK